jgi:hypothetical protein
MKPQTHPSSEAETEVKPELPPTGSPNSAENVESKPSQPARAFKEFVRAALDEAQKASSRNGYSK